MNFEDALKNRTLVCDGAMGTMLQNKGLPAGHCPEEWNISHPEVIQSIHSEYFNCGADIVETNTFGGNLYRLRHYNLENEIYDFNKSAAEIAKKTCPSGKFVAGSIGPTGEFLQPLGNLSFSDLENAFEKQVSGLIDGGVDVLFIETMSYIEEIKAVVSVTNRLDKKLPIIISMSFQKNPQGFFTMMGVSIADFIKAMDSLTLAAIGANCGMGIEEMIDIMEEFRQITDVPLIAQANAGLPEDGDEGLVYQESPERRKELTRVLLSERVNIIGGCCGTTPEHIQGIKTEVDHYQNK